MSTARRAWRGGKAEWKLHALSAFSLAVAFVCLGASLLVVFNLNAIKHRWERAGRASVYLQPSADQQAITKLRAALSHTPGVVSVRYVSSTDARHEVVGTTQDAALATLPDAAFPASLEIQMSESVTDTSLATMLTKLKQIPVVESVETYTRYTHKLKGLMYAAVLASLMLALVVLAAVVSVVASTVRLSLQRRQIEVEVLRLVGASESYVRRPFVLEGSVQGAVGALSAVLMLGLLYALALPHVAELTKLMVGVSPTFLPWYAVLGVLALGSGMGALSSHVSLRRMTSV